MAMEAAKPAIVVVPGAWHSPDAYAPMTRLLIEAGYGVNGVKLPSVGADPALQSWDGDVAAIRKAVSEAVDAGRDVVVVVHSYGGLPASEAVRGLAKKDREKEGKGSGVVRLVYICSSFGDVGFYLMQPLENQPLPWLRIEGDYVYPINPEGILYNDVDAGTARRLAEQLQSHSYKTFWSKVTYAAWKDIPSTYIVCEKDNAVPLAAQEGLLASTDVKFDVVRCDAGHSPFVSQPQFIADAIRRAAGA